MCFCWLSFDNHWPLKISILILKCAIYLCGMLHTAAIISAVCCAPLRSTLWCAQRLSQWCEHTTKIIFTVYCNTPWRPSPRCATHHGDHLRGMLHTTKIISAICCKPRRSSPRCVSHWGDHLSSVQHTVDIISAVCNIPRILSPQWVAHRRDIFVIQYLN